MSFQISALPLSEFSHLFSLSDSELAAHNALRLTAAKNPGFPCRVSLQDAEVGEQILLVHYEHHKSGSPFRSSHAVYVRPAAAEAHHAPDEVPLQLRTRVLSLRGFDSAGMMLEADLAQGTDLEAALTRLFSNPAIGYIHIHYAKPGCYAALATRA